MFRHGVQGMAGFVAVALLVQHRYVRGGRDTGTTSLNGKVVAQFASVVLHDHLGGAWGFDRGSVVVCERRGIAHEVLTSARRHILIRFEQPLRISQVRLLS